MNELLVDDKIKIENLIYEIRGKQVMLDSDLAKLYQCKNGTKDINKAVKRNIARFPVDFYFQLTDEEYNSLRFQNGTLKLSQGEHKKYLPHVFTEQGVAMLSSVLKSEMASNVSVEIMRAFVAMRKYISHALLSNNVVEHKLLEHDKRISLLEKTFSNFKDKNNHIFFEGQIYDAYSVLVDILNKATDNIVIIDNYIDKKFLDVCSSVNSKITIITNKINKIDLEKYNKQYSNIEIIISNSFHDRFMIIDNKILYHCGASFKDLGKKCFAISKINKENWIKELLNAIHK